MSDVIPDDASYEIDCPQCGKKIVKTIGWFKDKNVTCPFCGCGLDTGDSGRAIDEANESISEAWRELGERLDKLR